MSVQILGEKLFALYAPDFCSTAAAVNLCNIFIGGENVGRDDPRLQGVIGTISQTFDRLEEPEFKELLAAQSHISDKTVNRFTHIHQSREDLVNKSKMGRLLGAKTGCCFQRCVGMDALNALSIVTYEIDRKHGTVYNKRFLEYLTFHIRMNLACMNYWTHLMKCSLI